MVWGIRVHAWANDYIGGGAYGRLRARANNYKGGGAYGRLHQRPLLRADIKTPTSTEINTTEMCVSKL